ncbi:TetR/AcrR family transcriptional regulator [Pseudonocardia oroxyli]|uniref:Transcriptional regulator, TetR family n=1 Tax=Pseudonocardia oroxyli TaxID=366584 RepID=A0A1G7JIN2_PSEOR|nr:TetR/AcrR family transcriptional regulator [Pseudonocardia oroxyli]SDF24768.1 transcriptional regulator, TetR family [Pseudonocardia oroxyli]
MPARPRDSAATRAALLAAARELFASGGYDGTTVRAIAERAGVNQALLFRHFGSKDGLFTEAVTGQALEVLHDGPATDLVPRTVRAIMTGDDVQSPLFLSALRSAGNSDAAQTVREELRAAFGGALAELAEGEDRADAELRAELTLAWLLGIALLRTVLRTEAVAAADPEAVVAHVSAAVDTLLGTGTR